jgi:hypothetical protein
LIVAILAENKEVVGMIRVVCPTLLASVNGRIAKVTMFVVPTPFFAFEEMFKAFREMPGNLHPVTSSYRIPPPLCRTREHLLNLGGWLFAFWDKQNRRMRSRELITFQHALSERFQVGLAHISSQDNAIPIRETG